MQVRNDAACGVSLIESHASNNDRGTRAFQRNWRAVSVSCGMKRRIASKDLKRPTSLLCHAASRSASQIAVIREIKAWQNAESSAR